MTFLLIESGHKDGNFFLIDNSDADVVTEPLNLHEQKKFNFWTNTFWIGAISKWAHYNLKGWVPKIWVTSLRETSISIFPYTHCQQSSKCWLSSTAGQASKKHKYETLEKYFLDSPIEYKILQNVSMK